MLTSRNGPFKVSGKDSFWASPKWIWAATRILLRELIPMNKHMLKHEILINLKYKIPQWVCGREPRQKTALAWAHVDQVAGANMILQEARSYGANKNTSQPNKQELDTYYRSSDGLLSSLDESWLLSCAATWKTPICVKLAWNSQAQQQQGSNRAPHSRLCFVFWRFDHLPDLSLCFCQSLSDGLVPFVKMI